MVRHGLRYVEHYQGVPLKANAKASGNANVKVDTIRHPGGKDMCSSEEKTKQLGYITIHHGPGLPGTQASVVENSQSRFPEANHLLVPGTGSKD